jgi:hypothetical protein
MFGGVVQRHRRAQTGEEQAEPPPLAHCDQEINRSAPAAEPTVMIARPPCGSSHRPTGTAIAAQASTAVVSAHSDGRPEFPCAANAIRLVPPLWPNGRRPPVPRRRVAGEQATLPRFDVELARRRPLRAQPWGIDAEGRLCASVISARSSINNDE